MARFDLENQVGETVAVIRAWDYSMEWHLPDGEVLKGPSNPLELFALDRETKEAYLPQMKAGGISTWIAAGRGGGETRMGMSRGLSNEGPGVDDFDEAGVLMGSIPPPTGRQLLGFGRGPTGSEVAYLARTDEFDLMWLERYRVVRD